MSSTEVNLPQHNRALRTIVITALVTVALCISAYWLFTRYLFPSHFNPVELSAAETQTLNQKLQSVSLPLIDNKSSSNANALTPEAYSEKNALREVSFSEREINAYLAHNTDLSDKLVIDLSNDLISAKWLLPLDPEFPLLGGKTLKLTAGVEVAYRDEKPVIKLRGVSLWGVPLPDAWLGYMKNVDLIKEFGGPNNDGFWKRFADGIEYIDVAEGDLLITLKK